ncbi:MAG TPA: hypothetical protein VGX94_09255 [Terriglobia bacterium]|nr:hypothetical protein [Terriglobia bacterium]
MHDSHQKAAEYHILAAHAHRTAAEHHGQEDHLTGHEHSRQALEHESICLNRCLLIPMAGKMDRTEAGGVHAAGGGEVLTCLEAGSNALCENYAKTV